MGTRVLLAGATGAIGTRLLPLLLQGSAVVFGTTRAAARADELRSRGIEPIVVDVFDAPALTRAMVAVASEVVVHQLTDLALIHTQSRLVEALTRNYSFNLMAQPLRLLSRASSMIWATLSASSAVIASCSSPRMAAATFA